MVILVGPAQCQADILHGSNEGHRNEWLTARGFHDGPGAIASTHRPNVRVQPTGRFHESKIRDGPAVRVSNYFQRNSNKQQKTHVRRIALRLLFATNVAHDERWNTSHNLGDARNERAFRGGCASPRVVGLGTVEAPGRSHVTER